MEYTRRQLEKLGYTKLQEVAAMMERELRIDIKRNLPKEQLRAAVLKVFDESYDLPKGPSPKTTEPVKVITEKKEGEKITQPIIEESPLYVARVWHEDWESKWSYKPGEKPKPIERMTEGLKAAIADGTIRRVN